MEEIKRLALLIDAENISAKYIPKIIEELNAYGTLTYKRIYGDWTKARSSSWKDLILNYAISPIQQYYYACGKNACDSTMIIDAMDILYTHCIDGFCLVSSDSDFTRLAIRLREAGKLVIGMGETKTPHAFSAACTSFVYLDSPEEPPKETKEKPQKKVNPPKRAILTQSILELLKQSGGSLNLSIIGSSLRQIYPNFKPTQYGYNTLSKLLESMEEIVIEKHDAISIVYLKQKASPLNDIEKTLITIIGKSGNKGINLGEVNKQLIANNPHFSPKSYGYTKFATFMHAFDRFAFEDKKQKVFMKY